MLKRYFIFTVILSLFLLPTLATAQDDVVTIEYGEQVTGEITNRNYEVAYDFIGKKGDVLIAEMKPVESLGDLKSPEIILLDSEADIVGDTSGSYSYRSAVLAVQLPDDGTYTILASRSEGRAGESVGEFTLELIKPITLKVGVVLNDETTSAQRAKYYLIDAGNDRLNLLYEKIDGEFAPEISVNMINDDFGLTSVMTLGGSLLGNGQLTIPERNIPVVVKVDEASFDFNYKEVTVEYELQVVTAST